VILAWWAGTTSQAAASFIAGLQVHLDAFLCSLTRLFTHWVLLFGKQQ
jgi:hypothetical protein